MRKRIIFGVVCALYVCSVWAAVRGSDVVLRATNVETTNRDTANISSRTAVNSRSVSSRVANPIRSVKSRGGMSTTRATKTVARAGTSGPRGAITMAATRPARSANKTVSRATTTNIVTNTFDAAHTECQEAYFTCMDQFCALQNEKYRRCVCSGKLDAVQSRERALNNASVQLQDFKDLNIESILKTPAEVKAMLSATEGETKLTKKRDTSVSAQKLTAISDVLANTRTNAMSTGGQLDIAGDIKQIWTTTDLISGSNIANLTGESLYNAVHAQCVELVSAQCPSQSTLNMVVSAYGIQIENDCAIILAALDKQSVTANTAIRETNREMTSARLENYNTHNSTSINDCVAGVRADLTAETACGADFVHCLDITGLYLTRANATPIYSPTFYELNNQVSLAGDVLTNSTNAKLIAELNNKKDFAKNTLETCRDIADVVWDEFLRQAITEIYQGQQTKIRQVKDECMAAVNDCYDEKTRQLRDYSNIEEQMLLGDRLELSEQLCAKKLQTCSNLYGGGANGLELLIAEMHNITNQKIAQNCLGTLKKYAQDLCRTSSFDTLHDYPYGCRAYVPGDILYADNPACTYITNPTPESLSLPDEHSDLFNLLDGYNITGNLLNYACPSNRVYYTCEEGFYWSNNKCYVCPEGWVCPAGGLGVAHPVGGTCGDNYLGSLYQKMVVYALQYCVRPSESGAGIPNEVLADVNTVMDSVRVDMAKVLADECERKGGEWTTVFDANNITDEDKNMDFYNATNANLGWGLCRASGE